MDKVHWVYALCEPVSDAARYIGVTADVLARYKAHIGLKHGAAFNKELATWIKSLLAIKAAPGLRLLEMVDGGSEERASERECFWIRDMKNRGFALFNSVHFVPPRAGEEAFQERSIAGRIRAALNKLGMDAASSEIQAEVGPQLHCFEGHNQEWRNGQWQTVHPRKPGIVPISYINNVRSSYRRFLAVNGRD